MTDRITASPRAWALLAAVAAFASAAALAGCAPDNYYCDAHACYYCDGVGCRTATPPARATCHRDSECSAGQFCTDAGCVARCHVDRDCVAGWMCRGGGGDGGSGVCVAPTEPTPTPTAGTCRANADCDSGQVCVNGACQTSVTPACVRDADCTGGNLCVEGRCTPPASTCRFDNQCGAGRLCVNSECRVRCGGTTACPTGQECVASGSAMYCRNVAATSCHLDADCGAGHRCANGACYVSCTPAAGSMSTCAAELYCSDDGLCVPDTRPRPVCDNAHPCLSGSTCVGGVCRVPCSTTPECARVDVTYRNCGQIPYLSTPQNYCLTDAEARPTCSRQSECSAGQACVNGTCQ